jgi:hypothetical protein
MEIRLMILKTFVFHQFGPSPPDRMKGARSGTLLFDLPWSKFSAISKRGRRV